MEEDLIEISVGILECLELGCCWGLGAHVLEYLCV